MYLEWCGYLVAEKEVWWYLLDTIHECDGQTDTSQQHVPRLCIVSHGKNRWTWDLCPRLRSIKYDGNSRFESEVESKFTWKMAIKTLCLCLFSIQLLLACIDVKTCKLCDWLINITCSCSLMFSACSVFSVHICILKCPTLSNFHGRITQNADANYEVRAVATF